jgi:Domain of unknown function (DUF4288)
MGFGVRGLEEFGLTLRRLNTLGRLQVDVKVGLSPNEYDRRLTKLARPARLALYKSLKNKSIEHVLKIWPTKSIEFQGEKNFPHSFKSTVAAHLIPGLAKDKEIDTITLLRVPGHRKRRVATPRTLSWYAVRALVAIEVEEQKKGLQTTEDRILLVKAYSESDALRRLRDEWTRYESPSLNGDGYLFRWKMQKIIDIYQLFDDRIDPKGTEVYSKLGSRKMKPKYRWKPFKASNKAIQPTGRAGG